MVLYRQHCIWTLPPDDADFSTRWGLIKGYFSRSIEKGERISDSRIKRGERVFGKGGFGTILFETRQITLRISTTSIGIRSSMGW